MENFWTGVKVGAFILVVVGLIYYGYQIAQEQLAAPPCSAQGFPGRCYHIQPGVCETAWANAETECIEFVKKFNFGPGRLVGPAIAKCRLAKFDEQFPYSRRSTVECDESHVDMEDWKRRNMN